MKYSYFYGLYGEALEQYAPSETWESREQVAENKYETLSKLWFDLKKHSTYKPDIDKLDEPSKDDLLVLDFSAFNAKDYSYYDKKYPHKLDVLAVKIVNGYFGWTAAHNNVNYLQLYVVDPLTKSPVEYSFVLTNYWSSDPESFDVLAFDNAGRIAVMYTCPKEQTRDDVSSKTLWLSYKQVRDTMWFASEMLSNNNFNNIPDTGNELVTLKLGIISAEATWEQLTIKPGEGFYTVLKTYYNYINRVTPSNYPPIISEKIGNISDFANFLNESLWDVTLQPWPFRVEKKGDYTTFFFQWKKWQSDQKEYAIKFDEKRRSAKLIE